MNTKKRTIKTTLILIMACLVLSSCKTLFFGVNDMGVYDNTVPKEQLVNLFISHNYTVTEFDGKPVEWKEGTLYPTGLIRIPAGKHTIKYQYENKGGVGASGVPRQEIRNNQRVTVQTITQRGDGGKFEKEETIVFEAGKEYMIDYSGLKVYKGPLAGRWK